MRSIRDWRDERYQKATGLDPKALRTLTEEAEMEAPPEMGGGMDQAALRKVMGGGSTKIDMGLKTDLRPRLMQIIKDNPDQPPVDTLRQIIAIAGQLLGDMSGGVMTTSKLSRLGEQ